MTPWRLSARPDPAGAVMTTAATIARVLSERGYDFEIAHIFALQAFEDCRLTTCQSMTEAVAVVADMMMPRGVWADTDRSPVPQFLKPAGREPKGATRSAVSHGSWLVT